MSLREVHGRGVYIRHVDHLGDCASRRHDGTVHQDRLHTALQGRSAGHIVRSTCHIVRSV